MPSFRPGGPRRVLARVRVLTLLAVLALAAAAPASPASTISGAMWHDVDGDRIRDADEATMSDYLVYLQDAAGTRRLAYTSTGADGRYAFEGLADAAYRVTIDSLQWREIRQDWVPTTTGSVWPRVAVDLIGGATADFGWRPIVRATVHGAPLSAYTGPTGLNTESYNDAFSARDIHDALMAGELVGSESAATTIRFDHGTNAICFTSVTGGEGSYSDYRADIRIPWLAWLDQGDRVLFHEYGHAWSLYYAHIGHQSTALASYLEARGIALDDPRLDTSHAWSRRELIAEDYRQLFGTANSAATPQENTELRPAGDVPGLREFLATRYMEPAGSAPAPTPPLEPTPAPTPATAPITVAELTVNPRPVKTSGTTSFVLSAPAKVTAIILDSKGGLVRTLLGDADRPAGAVSALWDRKNGSGQRVKSGTYTISVRAIDATGAQAATSTAFKVS